jgi:hypothetical protein
MRRVVAPDLQRRRPGSRVGLVLGMAWLGPKEDSRVVLSTHPFSSEGHPTTSIPMAKGDGASMVPMGGTGQRRDGEGG